MILSEYVNKLDTPHTTLFGDAKKWLAIRDYTLFITQPFTLSMFIPTDDKGNVLKEPKHYKVEYENKDYVKKHYEYQKALDNVIFKGWELFAKQDANVLTNKNNDILILDNYDTIEDLLSKAEFTDKIKQKYGI